MSLSQVSDHPQKNCQDEMSNITFETYLRYETISRLIL